MPVTASGQSALGAQAILAALASAGPDPGALWAAYQVAAQQSVAARQMAGEATQAGGGIMMHALFFTAWQAQQAADDAYTAWQDAQARTVPGARG